MSDEGRGGGGGDSEARGRGVSDRLSRERDHRGGRGRRHPHDHRAPGAHRPAHGRRGEPDVVGPADRGVRDAARAGHGELVRRRRAGVRRFVADRRAPGRLPAPLDQPAAELQRGPELPARDQVGGAGDPARHGARRDAPRVHPGPHGAPAAGDGRVPAGCPGGRSARAPRVPPGRGRAPRPRSRGDRAGRGGAGGGRAAGHLRGTGRALRAGVGRRCARWPSGWARR